MRRPQVVRVLKRDQFGRVELLDGPRGPCVRRVACGSSIPGSRLVAHWLMRRERRALRRLAGQPGVGPLFADTAYESAAGERDGVPLRSDVLCRRWIEGTPLFASQELPRDFFERLEDLVRELHAQGVCHNDLHKEPNVLVGSDGRPNVLDFQLASIHRRHGRLFASRAREDLRHVEKHRLRYTQRGTPRALPPRSFVAAAWMRCIKPLYNLVTRRLLRTRDGEPRRPKGGPWPRWTDPIGPRPTHAHETSRPQ